MTRGLLLLTVPVLSGSVLLLPVLVLRHGLIVVTVVGASMVPTYRAGDRLLVRRVTVRALRTGQVVVLRYPHWAGRRSRPTGNDRPQWIVKRIAALPGDRFAHSGAIVPAGRLAVLGDNPAASDDSREFGPVPTDHVIGTVVRRLGRGPRR
jgi:signal peptidase I